MFQEVNLTGNSQAQLAVSTSAAVTSALAAGRYDIWATVDVYVKTAADPSGVTSTNGYLIRAGDTLAGVSIQEGHKIGAIAGASGTLSYHKVF